MNGTHQVLTYADVVKLIGDYISTIERNTGTLLNACKDVDLAVDVGKIEFMDIGCLRAMMKNEQVRSNSYEKVKTFKYLDSLLTNKNFIHEEIKRRLKAGNSCYY